jgi:small subunit ribosomal protein S18
MSRFNRFTAPTKSDIARTGANGIIYVDWKDVEELRRMMTPNGKIYGRKRLGTNAREQKLVAQAIKRARFMGLLPYTSATL